MTLYLRTNAASINAQRNFGIASNQLNKTIEQLSSGLRINRASDGAGSLAQADRFSAQVRGYAVAENNIQQGVSVLNIADSALQTIRDDLIRYKELATEAANGTVTDFTGYEQERLQIVANIDAVATGTFFGSGATAVSLLDGTSGAFNIQVGTDEVAANSVVDIQAAFADSQAAALFGAAPTAIASNANAATAIGEVDTALANLATNLAAVGGLQNQLQNRLEIAQISRENYAAAEASIRNVNVAEATSQLTQLQVVQQASALALAQANQSPQVALSLLG